MRTAFSSENSTQGRYPTSARDGPSVVFVDPVAGHHREEPVSTTATVVVRGGPDSVAKLAAHAVRTARAYALDGVPVYGISVFAALDDIGATSLDGILASGSPGKDRQAPDAQEVVAEDDDGSGVHVIGDGVEVGQDDGGDEDTTLDSGSAHDVRIRGCPHVVVAHVDRIMSRLCEEVRDQRGQVVVDEEPHAVCLGGRANRRWSWAFGGAGT